MNIGFRKNCFVYLFEWMLYVPVNSCGHVRALSPFYGTLKFTPNYFLGCHDIKKCFEDNHPSKQLSLMCIDGLF